VGWVSNPFVGLAERSFGVSPGGPQGFRRNPSFYEIFHRLYAVQGQHDTWVSDNKGGKYKENTEDVSSREKRSGTLRHDIIYPTAVSPFSTSLPPII